ncbi:hypothetical protein CCHR01_10862 [Colletotrichum chrysophilum]|uniref:Uncharacterized protein n=1 Tax=Colletotrichum chrysophilum TaxID=1836956 RepID=A0AAD9ECW9_9PEZI|nr:hypothetical protein CCHR01_10862 [Colletotrichum chrysophilum]
MDPSSLGTGAPTRETTALKTRQSQHPISGRPRQGTPDHTPENPITNEPLPPHPSRGKNWRKHMKQITQLHPSELAGPLKPGPGHAIAYRPL